MKCINKRILALCLAAIFALSGCGKITDQLTTYEQTNLPKTMVDTNFKTEEVCFTKEEISLPQTDGNLDMKEFHAGILFDESSKKILCASHIHDRIFPASTTKILTLYLALKYGDLEKEVTVSKQAISVPSDSSVAGLMLGDRLKLGDLLYGLMLPSGNDAAVAVAEAISGSVKEFVALMNKEATSLGAIRSHFTSPHGYQDEKHYTTAYDLYLLLREGVKYDKFREIVSTASYEATITSQNGIARKVTWQQSNQFINETYETPDGVHIIGGKTGTTDEAGACLTLYVEDEEQNHYFALLMGAPNKPYLYRSMKDMLAVIPTLQ